MTEQHIDLGFEIEYVYHLADIHIRNLKRHKEYRKVFKTFFKEFKNDRKKNSIIYLAGDIAHAKTEMSPELIREISWLLAECCKLAPTFLIAGNHDCNMNNRNRLDVLSPIVDGLKLDNLYYLRDTSVTYIGDTSFTTYSIFDDKENWPSGFDVKGKNKVCFFHGPVKNSQTDIGYTVSSNSFTSDIFDGFHMCMLGDIHKRQNVQEYDAVNNKPIISYSSSVIQQNHGELIQNHGYLIWDLKTRTYEERNIYNEFGYITIDVHQSKIPQWVYDEVKLGGVLPKRANIRVRFSDTPNSDMKVVIAELRTMFKVSELTFTRTDTISSMKSGIHTSKNIVGNVKDINVQNKLIRDYLESQFMLSDDMLTKVDELNLQINSLVEDRDVAESILWVPVKFEFDNMFSYGEGNSIEFEDLSGIIGLFAANASGKSSIWDALSFCLYDKGSRTFKAQHILNNRKDTFYCKFHFRVDEVDFFIERRAKKWNKGQSVKVDVDFWKIENGETISLNGDARRGTNHVIQEYIGTYDDFVLTALSLQGNNALFIDKSQSERKDILSQFIGLDIFDKLYQIAIEENRENSLMIRNFKREDFTSQLADTTQGLLVQSKLRDDIKNEIRKLELDINLKQELLDELKTKLKPISSTIRDIGDLVDEQSDLEELISTTKNDIDALNDKVLKLQKLETDIEDSIDDFDDIDELKSATDELFYVNTTVLDLENKTLPRLEVQLSAEQDKMRHLDEHEYNPDCDVCRKNNKSVIESKEIIGKSIHNINEEIISFKKDLNQLLEKRKELTPLNDQYKQYMELTSNLEKVDTEINKILTSISYKETQLLDYNKKLLDVIHGMKLYMDNSDAIVSNKKWSSKISVVEMELSSLKKSLNEEHSKLLTVTGKIGSLESNKEMMINKIEEIKGYEEKHKLFEYYLDAIKRDGVPYELISKSLPAIEGEVNNILGQVVDFGVVMEMDGKNINSYIVYDDQRWLLEMSSGMERFISGLAIRVALINVCNLPRPNFLILDEGMGALDSENLSQMYVLFQYLKTQFDFIIVISHLESMRDMVDDLIDIRKIDGFSYVKN